MTRLVLDFFVYALSHEVGEDLGEAVLEGHYQR